MYNMMFGAEKVSITVGTGDGAKAFTINKKWIAEKCIVFD
jgi:hypothetical protein